MAELFPFTPAANTDNCFSTDVLLHEGHSTVVDVRTSASKPLLQSLHTYSNIGIGQSCLSVLFPWRHGGSQVPRAVDRTPILLHAFASSAADAAKTSALTSARETRSG